MNKITIIIGAAAAVIAASAVGYTYYMTHPSVECTTDSFSFKIPRGFKVNDNEYIQDTYGQMYKYGFGGDIIITEMDSNQTPRAFSETLGEDDAERKKIDGTPLECYNIENNTKHEKDNVYLTGTDNHFLIMETDSSFINGFLGDMAMKNIVKTVKYTSDYRLADLPDEYDNEYFHISTGVKYSFSDFERKEEGVLAGQTIRYRESDDKDKDYYPALSIGVLDSADAEKNAENYDKRYESKINDPEHYHSVVRDKQELFGYEAEHVHFEHYEDYKGTPVTQVYDMKSFIKDGHTYYVNMTYIKDRDEADIQEMLDCISIK
ncbi:MAG: hypothetical protein IKH96_02315 [Ruminococcus sp.]|uniref:hypothetical protein n=1 Tax=Ruminococcus sp. TaxID=41978 RepID=UPI0025E7196D|nr:hypothetical protein [Ruminococcus sp.]MBR6994833.1 hypothetical protein [Ruminococcus sp.]